jgi:hypothetical protein
VRSAGRHAFLCAALLASGWVGGSELHIAAAAEVRPPDAAAVEAAVAQLNADPNLVNGHKLKRLHWTGKGNTQQAPSAVPDWLMWLRDLFGWIAQTARLLLWVAALVLVAILGVYLYRFLDIKSARRAIPKANPPPSHVRDLDIRPESLPSDIGAAVLSLWQGGEHRAALSLLYRGLLSRLVHVYTLPIRDSSTEGDCMQLASSRLDSTVAAYVSRVVRTWQHAVYGGIEPSTAEVIALCGDFRL